MAPVPQIVSPTVAAIFAAYEKNADERHRPHLGGSRIGHPCDRHLWYGFRWAGKERFDGRMLRLFQTGHLEEPRFIEDLKSIGAQVTQVDSAGNRMRIWAFGGHFGGEIDGKGTKLPEAPAKEHLLEFKTHSAKSFDKLVKDGVRVSKPLHYAQVQVYMLKTGIEQCLYLARKKDNDDLYAERIKLDVVYAQRMMARAERIIQAEEPPPRISKDHSYFECKYCNFHNICHGFDTPEVNCRTCLHATPRTDIEPKDPLDGQGGQWDCAVWGEGIPLEAQRTGCGGHRYIPIFLAATAKPVNYIDAQSATGVIVYQLNEGPGLFANGDGAGCTVTSQEIRACGSGQRKDTLVDACIAKATFPNAKVVA